MNNSDGVLNSHTLATVRSENTPSVHELPVMGIVDVYDVLVDHRAGKLRERLAKLENEHSALADKVVSLTAPKLIQRLNQKAHGSGGQSKRSGAS